MLALTYFDEAEKRGLMDDIMINFWWKRPEIITLSGKRDQVIKGKS